jgi:tetratricopeptide (TPR) repeat protein
VVRLADRFPDRRYGLLINGSAALVYAGDDEAALAMLDRALPTGVDGGAGSGLELKTVGARAQILARLGRHTEAAAAAEQVQEWADRLDDPTIAATATYDRGLLAIRAGRHAEAAELIGRALAGKPSVSRVAAGLQRAEALAVVGDSRGAQAQLRQALLEPVGRSDQPWALVPRIAWVQALIAHAEGDTATARRRLEESATAWRRVAGSAGEQSGEDYVASLVDLGRPPVVGLVEPARELGRIAELSAALDAEPAPVR